MGKLIGVSKEGEFLSPEFDVVSIGQITPFDPLHPQHIDVPSPVFVIFDVVALPFSTDDRLEEGRPSVQTEHLLFDYVEPDEGE